MSDTDSDEADAVGDERERARYLIRIGLVVVLAVGVVLAADVIFGLGFVSDDGRDGTGTSAATPVPMLTSTPTAGEATQTPGIESGESPPPEESPAATDEPTPTTAAGVTVRGDTRQFQFTVLGLEKCGRTCRDANVELTNSGESATDVAATSRLYAGEAGEDQVWQGTEEIGDMAAGETVRRTTRIELSLVEGSKVCSADTVTLVTVVASTDHRQQFTSHPDVGC